MKLYFNLNYYTKPGENLELITHESDQAERAHKMFHTGNGEWKCEIDFFSKSMNIIISYAMTMEKFLEKSP